MMRGVLSIFIAISLLLVSSVPTLGLASSCEFPAHEKSMAEHHIDGQVMHDQASEQSSEQHLNVVVLGGDLPLNRIECGCGCHRSVDALPQLLAPHAFSLPIFTFAPLMQRVASQSFAELHALAARIPVPPPRLIFS